ncbi:MAG: copper chaperone PCu(A)C [Gammaproteobacteria bacterium]|nr:copper chaperone PCu(A)C [Gammaproteobacteria bacterium]
MRTATLLLLLLLAACADVQQPPLVASDVTITQPMPGKTMRAAYLALTNNTNEAIRISRVSSDAFANVELHETTVVDGVARMRRLPLLQVPAGGTVRLERGGKHLMLMRPTDAADKMSLEFFDGDDLLLAISAPLTPGSD